jgi:diacylglycerol kinase family enzyme
MDTAANPSRTNESEWVPTNPWPHTEHPFANQDKPSIGILHNPASGQNKRETNFIKKILPEFPKVSYQEVQSPNEVLNALRQFAAQNIQVIAINAGDGTVHATLTGLLHHHTFHTLPLLAVFPSGTTNLIAEDVGIQGAREEGLHKLLAWSFGQETPPSIVHRHVLKVHITPNQEPVFGMFFGTGAITQGIQACRTNEQKFGRLGRLGEGWIITQFLFGLLTGQRQYVRPIPITVTSNGEAAKETEYLAFLATTMERLFFGLRPYWGEEPHPLHYTAINGAPKHLLRTLPSLLFGRTHRLGIPENGYHSHNSPQLQLSMKDDVILDGESYTPNPELGPITIQTSAPVSFLRW